MNTPTPSPNTKQNPTSQNQTQKKHTSTPSTTPNSHPTLTMASYLFLPLIFATTISVFLYRLVGFQLKNRTGVIFTWLACICFWGWTMVASMYGMDRLALLLPKIFHPLAQLLFGTLLLGTLALLLYGTFV